MKGTRAASTSCFGMRLDSAPTSNMCCSSPAMREGASGIPIPDDRPALRHEVNVTKIWGQRDNKTQHQQS